MVDIMVQWRCSEQVFPVAAVFVWKAELMDDLATIRSDRMRQLSCFFEKDKAEVHLHFPLMMRRDMIILYWFPWRLRVALSLTYKIMQKACLIFSVDAIAIYFVILGFKINKNLLSRSRDTSQCIFLGPNNIIVYIPWNWFGSSVTEVESQQLQSKEASSSAAKHLLITGPCYIYKVEGQFPLW